MPPKAIIEFNDIPQTAIVDREGLRLWNPQRFEMEQLTAITLLDSERMLVVGYKDVSPDEFWVKGHMPGYPLLPGVLMCEAAAQLCAYYCRYSNLMAGDFVAFGGMENVRFRGAVRPGQRLWLVGRTTRHSTRRMVFEIQGFVDGVMVFNGDFIGVPFSKNEPTTPDD
jgi:3-hydroxyacyl-[acyl-carrier-protein] dehydratase